MKVNFRKILQKIINFYPFIIFFVIIIYVTRKFLFKEGYVIFGELPTSTDYFFFLKDFLKSWSDLTILGRSNIGFPTTYGLNQAFMVTPPMPNLIWFSFMSLLQLIFSSLWSVKIYILLALLLPFISMYYFAQFWFKELEKKPFLFNTLAFISGLIYSINNMVGDRIFAGHLFYNFGYGIFPLFLLFIFKSVETQDVRERTKFILFAGFISSILVWLMPHLFIIILIPLFFYFLLFLLPNINKIRSFFITGIFIFLIGLILTIYLWLPALFYSEIYPYFKNSVHILSYLYSIAPFVTFDKIITLTSDAEQSFLMTKEKLTSLFYLKLFLPFLTIVGLILTKEKRKSLFAFLLIIFGIVLGMGVNYPFENMYKYLYQNLILFSPFRDTSKFIILYIFGMSLTIPVIFIYLDKMLKKVFLPTVVLFTIFILFINSMFTSGNFGNNIVPFKYPKKYEVLKEFLSQQKDNFRIAVYPNDKYVGNYDWFPKSPNGSIHPTLFSFFFPLNKSLAVSNRTIGNYSSRYLDYLENNLNSPFAVNRLGQEMVKYIIVDPSMKGYEKDLEKLRSNSDVSEIKLVDGFYIFESKKFSPQIIKKQSPVYYYGDIKGINNLPPDLALINLGLNSIDILSKNYSNDVILFNTSVDDVFYNSLNKFNFSFFPEVRFKTGTKEFYIPGEYLRDLTLQGINFYNPEIIATTGKNNIKKISDLKRGKYKILLSSLNYEKLFTNTVKVTIDNTPITRTNFSKKNNTFEWVDFGEIEIKKDKPLITVENLEDNSFYLDYLLIVPVDQYKKLQKDFYSVIRSKKIINLKESESFDIDSIKQNQKSIYVFSQSFSPYWKICDSPVFRVNFFATGVACNKEINLNPQFRPEMLYKISLSLSFIFHLSLILFIIKLYKKHDKTN